MIYYSVLILISVITVPIKSQICFGVAQYARCSSSNACGCFHMINTDNTGICGFLWASCSQLVPCNSSDHSCSRSNTICIRHPRCHALPLCYPVAMMDERYCPSSEDITNTTTTHQPDVLTSGNMINLHPNATWNNKGETVAGYNSTLFHPFGIYVDDDQTIYIADSGNNRIIAWKAGEIDGEVIAGGQGQGNGLHQLNEPTDVILDKENDSLIICDSKNKRIVRWSRQNKINGEIIHSNVSCFSLKMDRNKTLYIVDKDNHQVKRYRMDEFQETIVAGSKQRGSDLNQLDLPYYVFIDEENSLFVSDCDNDRVMKWSEGAKEGIVVAGGQRQGDKLHQLFFPKGILIDSLGTVYIADSWNHRIVRWFKGALKGTIIAGGNGQGKQANQLNAPTGLAFDRYGNLYVADYLNHRIQRFTISIPSN